jgi:hypothetical protein
MAEIVDKWRQFYIWYYTKGGGRTIAMGTTVGEADGKKLVQGEHLPELIPRIKQIYNSVNSPPEHSRLDAHKYNAGGDPMEVLTLFRDLALESPELIRLMWHGESAALSYVLGVLKGAVDEYVVPSNLDIDK